MNSLSSYLISINPKSIQSPPSELCMTVRLSTVSKTNGSIFERSQAVRRLVVVIERRAACRTWPRHIYVGCWRSHMTATSQLESTFVNTNISGIIWALAFL